MLEIELELDFVRDGDVRSDEGSLVVIEAFSERGKVLMVVPLCKVGVVEFLLCLYIKRAPCQINVFKDLEGGCVAVGCVTMF